MRILLQDFPGNFLGIVFCQIQLVQHEEVVIVGVIQAGQVNSPVDETVIVAVNQPVSPVRVERVDMAAAFIIVKIRINEALPLQEHILESSWIFCVKVHRVVELSAGFLLPSLVPGGVRPYGQKCHVDARRFPLVDFFQHGIEPGAGFCVGNHENLSPWVLLDGRSQGLPQGGRVFGHGGGLVHDDQTHRITAAGVVGC